MSFTSPTQLLSQIITPRRLLLLAAVLGVALLIPETTFAQAGDGDSTQILNSINQIINLILRSLSMILWPVIAMIGSLLDNELIFGGAMGTKLQALWVQIRNLVNIGFVLVLLAIAVYNVLGVGEESGSVPLAFKTVMPKFVIALLLVNFSFLGAKVVLDFTNVLTGAVFALPGTVGSNNNMIQLMEASCANSSKEKPLLSNCDEQGQLTEKARDFFRQIDKSNITMVYAIKFAQAHQFKFVKDDIRDITQLGFNIIFNTVLFVVYAASFVALFVVLLLRLVILWVGVVASPLVAVAIVFPNIGQLLGEGENLKDLFLNNALAPLKIGLVLSIGYIMLDAFQADPSLHGELLSSNTLSSLDPNALVTGITDLQQLMVAVASVAIIWTGVFGAAEKTVAKGITGFISEHLKSFGKFAAKLPTYAQVIPVGDSGLFGKKKGENVTLQQLIATGRHGAQILQQKRGTSLLSGAVPVSHEFIRNLQTKPQHEVGEVIIKNPEQLFNPQNWAAFRERVIRDNGGEQGLSQGFLKSQDLRDFARDGNRSDVQIIDNKVLNGALRRARIDTPTALLQKADTASRQTPSQQTSPTTQAPKIVAKQDDARAEKRAKTKPAAIAAKQGFFEELEAAEIQALYGGTSEQLFNAIIDSHKKSNGNLRPLSVDQISAIKSFAQDIEKAKGASDEQGAIKTAIKDIQAHGVHEDLIISVVNTTDNQTAKTNIKQFVKQPGTQ
ncbi:hypothetical protein COV82_00615 [Candidatus Peregrinibacteria bacterium CG11_big_fil_rev_8_21_14_0_20_46_8]|nr:MAG: hypothetical protein COV82_00615 [Candidatus Peregrinibacteria bacterium CG11_big_fil_rev_8_21_14_0_20_46_8]